jgi:hypothetical protein
MCVIASSRGSSIATLFTEVNVKQSPQEVGVYLLYRASRLIYVGMAMPSDTIMACLLSHHSGGRGPCTQAATEFKFEVSPNPAALHDRYLSVYAERNAGKWPECNEKTRRTRPSTLFTAPLLVEERVLRVEHASRQGLAHSSTANALRVPSKLSAEEKEQLTLIARALERNEKFEHNPALLDSLIKKCLIRTWDNTLKLTEQGLAEIKQS